MTTSREGTAPSALQRRSAGIVIDGEAVVVARVQRMKSAVERAASAPVIFASDDPAPLARVPDVGAAGRASADEGSVFGRRGSSPSRGGGDHDLFFQRAPRGARRAALRSRSDSLSIFLRDTAGSIPAGGRLAGLGLLVLSLIIPAAMLIGMDAAVPARASAGASQVGFVIENLEAGISPRGRGEVLQVEGAVRNVSGEDAPLPPLRIALLDAAGTTTLRALGIGSRTLANGETLRFHSAVAVPVGTEGDVSVAFVDTIPPLAVLEVEPGEAYPAARPSSAKLSNEKPLP
ncbi:MAG: hypothetical protein H7Y08_04640 [Rhizobiaceae bacterium]|nr:hypothetical protein [Rhizobiaceae bacterium]